MDCALARAYVPALQFNDPLQAAEVNPVELPYVPAGQFAQTDAAAKEYLPRPHILQPAAFTVPEPVTVPA